MAQIKRALLKFEDSKYNHTRGVSPTADDSEIMSRFLNVMIQVPQAPYLTHKKCIDVEISTYDIKPMNQAEFSAFYNQYMEDLKNKGVHAFCSNVRALSAWTRRTFDTWSCSWDFTKETVIDMFGYALQVGVLDEHRFVLVNLEQTKIFDHCKQNVRCCNDGEYGRSRPAKREGDSFYNNSGELIFYFDDEQKKELERQLQDEIDTTKAWDEYRKVRDGISLTNWVKCHDIVAMHFLESVPPVRMGGARFLAGEAADHTPDGYAMYQEFRRLTSDEWETKYSTVAEYEKTK